MDYKRINFYASHYYFSKSSLPGREKIIPFMGFQPLNDENSQVEAMASIYIMGEASIRHKEGSLGMDDIVERLIDIYGLNGFKKDTVENLFIREILASDGHLEYEFVNDGAISSKYRILIGPNKNTGVGVLRYIARKQGFDIDKWKVRVIDLNTYTSEESKERGSYRILVDFVKTPVLDYKETVPPRYVSNGGKDVERRMAEKQLEMARNAANPNPARIKYWEDILAGKKPRAYKPEDQFKKPGFFAGVRKYFTETAKKITDFWTDFLKKRKEAVANGTAEEFNEETIRTIEEEIKQAETKGDVEAVKGWQELLVGVQRLALTAEDPNLVYLKEQLKIAVQGGIKEEIDHWKNMLDLSDPALGAEVSGILDLLDLARKSHDEVSIERWESVLNNVLFKEPVIISEEKSRTM